MKRILTLIFFCLTIQYSFGQACGKYRIKYVGNVLSEPIKVEKLKLPTIEFLHGLEIVNSEYAFIEIELSTNEISTELISHLTSNLYEKAESLHEFYKSKRESMPIIIIVEENGIKKEIHKELSWNNIQITEIDDSRFGRLFEVNLKEITLE